MIPYLGDFVEDDVVYLMFNTFSSDDPSASVTITNFINTDVHIHKDDGLTQRNNAAGITVSVNFDGITGSHLIKIDTNDNTVAGFWVTGHDYFVRIEGTTIDGATINAVVGHFSVQNRYMRGTASAALATVCTEARLAHLDADVSSRNATTPPTVTAIREEMDTNSTKMAPSQVLADYKATGFSTHNAAAVKTAIEAVGSSIATILADTNELELDWKNGGRLDLILDIIAADTTTDIPALILKYIQLLARSDAAVATDNATELTAINADGGSGAGDFSNQTDAVEALRDRGDAAWVSATGFSTHDAAAVKTAIEAAGSSIAAMLADTNELQTNQGNWATATGFSTHNAAAVKTAIEAAGSSIATVLADTNELQTDLKDGGRLDLLIDAILLDTGTTLDAMMKRILGLNQENFYIDTAVFSGANMTSCRIRLYSVAGSVGGASDVIATYNMTATYSGSNLASYKVVKA